MTTTDKRKRSLYFPDTILKEMQVEAKRQERSLSWIVQYAWRIARSELMRLPSVGDAEDGGMENNLDQDSDRQAGSSHDGPHQGHHSFSGSEDGWNQHG